MRWTPILYFAGLIRTVYSWPRFGLVSVLIVLPSSLKTTFTTFTPRTRARNVRATQPVGAASCALPPTTVVPRTYCETEALGWPPDEEPEVLAMTAEPPLSISARARNAVTTRGLRRPRARV